MKFITLIIAFLSCATGWASSPEIWSPRYRHQSVVFKDRIWIIGGANSGFLTERARDRGKAMNDVWVSNNGTTWTCVINNAPWVARYGHKALVFDGKIWILGGRSYQREDGGPESVQGKYYTDEIGGSSTAEMDPALFRDPKVKMEYLDDVWCSINGQDWICVTSKAGWSPRMSHEAFVFNDKLWIIGGLSKNGALNDIWHSNDGIHWSKIDENSIPFLLYDRKVTVLNKQVWMIGMVDRDPYNNEVWTSTNAISWECKLNDTSWKSAEHTLETGYALEAYLDQLYVLGGQYGQDYLYLNDVWKSEDGKSWQKIEENSGWIGRFGHTSAVFQNKLWIFGGLNVERRGFLNDVWCYDPVSGWVNKNPRNSQ